MEDFFGRELSIGDVVAVEAPRYRMLVKATVVAFTPKQVRVEYINNWNSSEGRVESYLTSPAHLIKRDA